MKPNRSNGSYGLISNSLTEFFISFILKNIGHGKLCTHFKGHFDNNICQKSENSEAIVSGCLSANVWKWVCGSFFKKDCSQ